MGDIDFGSKTSEGFRNDTLLPFFRAHLLDGKPSGLPPARLFETGRNRWRDFPAWPPTGVQKRDLHFGPGESLGFDPPHSVGFEEWQSDPRRPVPFWNGIEIGMPKDYMVADQRFAATRPDVAVFRTEVLDEDLTVAGPMEVKLRVSTSGTDSDWVVKVIDVQPDDAPDPDSRPGSIGSAGTGHSRMGGYQQLVRGEAIRGKFRDSLAEPAPFTPGVPTPVAFQLNDVLHTFRKGHRIMVQVQCSWFPLMDLNPQVFTDIYRAKREDFRKATQRLHFGPGGSRIVLPVLPQPD
jgi:hypothetical protein